MKIRPGTIRGILLALDAIVLVAYVAAALTSAGKPTLSIEWTAVGNGDARPVVTHRDTTERHVSLHPGDVIAAINGIELQRVEDVEQVVDGLSIGNTYPATVVRDGQDKNIDVTTGAYYRPWYLVIQFTTAFLFFALAVFVGFKRPTDRSALLFHHLGLSIGGIVMFTVSGYTLLPLSLGHIVRGLFPASFLFSAVLLAHFSVTFPRPRKIPRWTYFTAYIVVLIISIIGLTASLIATLSVNLEAASWYYLALSAGKIILVAGALFAIGMFLYNHKYSEEFADRIQLKWVLFGTSICIFTYIFLWQIPNSIVFRFSLPDEMMAVVRAVRIPEEYLLLSVLFAAICMAVALLRFRAFDIEVIVRRSTLYGLVFGLLTAFYVILLGLSWSILHPLDNYMRYVIATIIMAFNLVLFLPARGLVQRILDKYFYRVRYNYRDAIRVYSEGINHCITERDVSRTLVDNTRAFFNPDKAALLLVQRDGTLKVTAQFHFDGLKQYTHSIDYKTLRGSGDKPIALKNSHEPDASCEVVNSDVLARLQVCIAIPLLSEKGTDLGFLVLGEKKSKYRYSAEDIDLLQQAVRQAALQIARIRLQQDLWLEQQEAERLEELNDLKSYFVSSVSHDLKTPITSIRIFGELLRDQTEASNPEAEKYFNIIEGECERLTRLINNVLDYAKIEQGVKHYNFTPGRINDVVTQVMDIMGYQLRMSGFEIESNLSEDNPEIRIDEDAMIQTLTNLITNAIKYSGDSKYIRVSTATFGDYVSVSVEDHGIGIGKDKLQKVFEPYYRVRGESEKKKSGTGLGLALVLHTVNAHEGHIDIDSHLGEGTTITMNFPFRGAE